MAKYPGLMPRGRRWYLRAKVPVDLTAFLGRAEIWRSLRTGDHAVAVKRYRRARADLNTWFDQQRRRQDAGEKINGEAPGLVTGWFHQVEREACPDPPEFDVRTPVSRCSPPRRPPQTRIPDPAPS